MSEIRHIQLISGADSLATAILQSTIEPDLNYERIFNDVDAELPETYAWILEVEKKMDWRITRLGESLPAKIHWKVRLSHHQHGNPKNRVV